jgi:translocation and assembly module TamB
MTRRMRIFRNVGIGLAASVTLVVVAAILVVRTDWFRNYVRQKIITATEQGTGGRVEVGSFAFDWTHESATVTDFVIHGNEPAGSAPYLRAERVEIHLRLFSRFKRLLDITYLAVQRPQANILLSADGTTNVPQPKASFPTSKETPLQTVVDLAVGHFDLANGSVSFNSRKQDFDLRGESLHVQLWYDLLKQGYKGEISLAPLYVVNGRNTPVKFLLTLPVTLDSDRIAFQNGRISTDASQLQIDGFLENLKDPKTSAHIQGHVALADLKNVENLQLAANPRGLPTAVALDVNATVAGNAIDVSNSHIAFGASTIDASGKLQDPAGNGALQFRAQLVLAELGRLANLQMRPDGTLRATGLAKMDAQRNYDIQGTVDSPSLSFRQGLQGIRNVTLSSAAHLTPHRLDLDGFRIGILGAEIAGSASLEDFARYVVNANLRHLDLQTMMRELGQKNAGYSGTVLGRMTAMGDLSAAGSKSLAADVRLSIAPGRQGVPVSGRLFAGYRGDTDNLHVSDSYIALPHTRLNVNGSLGDRLNVTLSTADLRDFSPLTSGAPPVGLSGGHADFAGVVTGRLTSSQITGHLAMDHFAVQGRQFDALAADVAASSSRAALSTGSLRRGAMQTQFSAAVGLQDWKVTQNQPFAVQATVRDGDLADVVALAGTPPAGYFGALSAEVNLTGTIANPRGAANLTVANGTLHDEPIDSLQVQVNLTDQLVTVSNAQIAAGQSRVNLTGEFHHPRDHFDRGHIQAHVQTSQVDLARLRTVQSLRPDSAGTLQATADIAGELRSANKTGETEFLLTNVTADASGRGLRIEGQDYGAFTGMARTSGNDVQYNVSSDFAGSQIRVNGDTQLAPGYPTKADANIAGLAIERVLVVAKRTDIPAKGTLSATAYFAGTMEQPEGSLDATVDRAVFEDEPIDRVHARVTYLPNSIDVPQLEIRAGNSSLDASAHYDHAGGVLTAGDLQFRINSGHVDLARARNVQKLRPGLAGTLQLTANGAATLRQTEPRILARDLNLNFTGKGIAAQGKNFGDLTLTANTTAGRVNFALDSNLAGAAIQGRGIAQLSGDYPVTAQVTLHNVTWKGLQPLLAPPASGSTDFDVAADGEMNLNGPAVQTEAMTGRLQLSRVQFTAAAPGPRARTVTVENEGPIVVALDHGVARIESLHLTGPQTDVQAHGSASLTAQTMDTVVKAHTDLALIQRFRRDVDSSGQLVADVTLRGTFAKPVINGKAELHNASVNVLPVPTGLSNANGVVDFNGTNAQFRNLTGEVGGGKVILSGFVSYSDIFRLALRVNATRVRLRLQPGVSAVADADLRLSGRTDASILSGTVTVDQITYAPQSDFGAILSRAAPPVQSPATSSPLLDNMKLDVQVRTSSATSVQAAVAQNLQMEANLRIQGTASEPGVAGRITINQGKLVFFSSNYTVNSGTIAFYNPIRIEPVLDLSLETQAKGVDVTLRVTGPIDNMKLSYTSDPPIQFQEIVGLLAAGQTPTSDPTLLANQPAQPSQNFQQMGESALLAKGLADPIANRLQRVFGVSQFKIDPSFAGNSDLPQAQVSLQQQVTPRLTLTYTTALDDPSVRAVSGEFILSRQWSATATRDQYGLFNVKFLYKKQFR